jgi:hypothetical protein
MAQLDLQTRKQTWFAVTDLVMKCRIGQVSAAADVEAKQPNLPSNLFHPNSQRVRPTLTFARRNLTSVQLKAMHAWMAANDLQRDQSRETDSGGSDRVRPDSNPFVVTAIAGWVKVGDAVENVDTTAGMVRIAADGAVEALHAKIAAQLHQER